MGEAASRVVFNDISFGFGMPPIPVNALVLDAAGATLYAGTDVGVYFTSTAALNWAVFGTGLPFVQVDDPQLQSFPNVGTFLAADFG
jgi:hypothetical protein